jgi:hypothetical protein
VASGAAAIVVYVRWEDDPRDPIANLKLEGTRLLCCHDDLRKAREKTPSAGRLAQSCKDERIYLGRFPFTL